jgi:large subunit ribosomal protein L7/L12
MKMELNKEQVMDYLSTMTVMEIAGLVQELEEKWGVSATPSPQITQEKGAPTGPTVEPTEFDVVLDNYGAKKIDVIKAIRKEISGLGLREAKELVESAPVTIKEATSKEEAEELKAKLEGAGGKITIK